MYYNEKNLLHTLDIADCIEHDTFETAAGLTGNLKINFEKLPPKHPLFQVALDRAGKLALEKGCTVISAVANGPNAFAARVANEFDLSLVVYKKTHDSFWYIRSKSGGLRKARKGERVLAIEDVRSTGMSIVRFVDQIGLPNVFVTSIINRGAQVSDVHTIEESIAYSSVNPDKPPANINLPVPDETLFSLPLPLWASGSN